MNNLNNEIPLLDLNLSTINNSSEMNEIDPLIKDLMVLGITIVAKVIISKIRTM